MNSLEEKILYIKNNLVNLYGNILQIEYVAEHKPNVLTKFTETYIIKDITECGWYKFNIYNIKYNELCDIKFNILEVENFLKGKDNLINFKKYSVI